MRLTVQVSDDFLNLDVGPDMTVADLKAVLEADTNTPPASQMLHFNGVPISNNSQTLGSLGVSDGEMMSMTTMPAPQASRPAQRGIGRQNAQDSGNDSEILRLQWLGDPATLERWRQRAPELANAINDPRVFREEYLKVLRRQNQAEREKQEATEALNNDPFDVEAQRKIEEIIREENVQANFDYARDHNPEVFGRVHMLYIDVEVNGHKVKAFVDSGAQTTIMSPSCAENCGIMRLVDKRFAGIARGVGTANIIGRVHSAQIKLGGNFLPCSFTVMEGKDVDLLLGLDMLKRHQACIDLKKGNLIIRDEEIPFLDEGNSPKSDENVPLETTVQGPGGTRVSGISGEVLPAGAVGSAGAQEAQTTGQGSGTSSSSAQPTAQQQSASRFPLADVEQLMSFGASREEAINALEIAGGNVEVAAGMLMYD